VPKFYVSVRVTYELGKVIEATDEREAARIAAKLSPEDFDNFDYFYEWLGSNWNILSNDMRIEKID